MLLPWKTYVLTMGNCDLTMGKGVLTMEDCDFDMGKV